MDEHFAKTLIAATFIAAYVLVAAVNASNDGSNKQEIVSSPNGILGIRGPDGTVRSIDFDVGKESSNKKQFSASNPKTGSISMPDPTALKAMDENTRKRALAAWRGYYDYRVSGYEHRKRVFEWQLKSSKYIFVIVVMLVFAGIVFAAIQFYSSLNAKQGSGGDKGDATELSASYKGIKVSSPVLGVIILVISFLFFYMYLVHVYPIEEIF
jgi:hypothetical protein